MKETDQTEPEAVAGDDVWLTTSDTGKGMDAGVSFLQKPLTIQTLAEKAREVLDATPKPPRQP